MDELSHYFYFTSYTVVLQSINIPNLNKISTIKWLNAGIIATILKCKHDEVSRWLRWYTDKIQI